MRKEIQYRRETLINDGNVDRRNVRGSNRVYRERGNRQRKVLARLKGGKKRYLCRASRCFLGSIECNGY